MSAKKIGKKSGIKGKSKRKPAARKTAKPKTTEALLTGTFRELLQGSFVSGFFETTVRVD